MAGPIEDVFGIDSCSESEPELSENVDQQSAALVIHPESDKVPKCGMFFTSEREAFDFYNKYARNTGFSVRRGQYRRLSDGTIRKRSFLCSKEGVRKERDPAHIVKVNRLETRTSCNAMIRFTIDNGTWIVDKFISEHNHKLAISDQADMLSSQRHINEAQADVINTMDNAGVPATNIYSCFVEEARGAENVGFQKLDCENFLRSKRLNTIQAGDAQSVINHFKHMQAEDPSFFYTVQVDFENRMANFFWRDGRSKIDYSYFSDVVVFDTTYRTNKYNMVLAPFLGVNHHRQNILLGCAFLLVETTESFIWLFQSFLEAMGRKQPISFFTDQCHAMAKAVEKVFPETQHRLCLWHIGQNAAKHLSHYYRQLGFRRNFNRCLYDCETKQEFQERWDHLLKEYDLMQNSWLEALYKLKEKWCPPFSQDYFSAGISSTQRSESLNNVFRKVTSRTMSLTKFVLRYERVANKMRRAEVTKDFSCHQGVPPRVGKLSGMIKQASKVYTHAIFQLFQEALFECLSVTVEEIDNDGVIYNYKLIRDGDQRESIVKFQPGDYMVDCSCKKFESMGILCCHGLRFLNARNIFSIPPQYILKRWTKGAKDGVVMNSNEDTIIDKTNKPIMNKAVHVATKGALTGETSKLAEDLLDNALGNIESVLKSKKIDESSMGKEVETDNEDEVGEKDNEPSCDMAVLDPPHVSLKGVSNARIKSNLEKKNRKRKIPLSKHKSDNASRTIPQSKRLAKGLDELLPDQES